MNVTETLSKNISMFFVFPQPAFSTYSIQHNNAIKRTYLIQLLIHLWQISENKIILHSAIILILDNEKLMKFASLTNFSGRLFLLKALRRSLL